MKTKLKFKEIASDWFESLSEKNQKAYIAMHPDSKFAHKVGTGQKNPAVTKSKNKQMEHLEQEGVDVGKDYFGHSSNAAGKIGSVADLSGKNYRQSDKSSSRALLDDLSSHRNKIKVLQSKLQDLNNKIGIYRDKIRDSLGEPNHLAIIDKHNSLIGKREKLKDQISELLKK